MAPRRTNWSRFAGILAVCLATLGAGHAHAATLAYLYWEPALRADGAIHLLNMETEEDRALVELDHPSYLDVSHDGRRLVLTSGKPDQRLTLVDARTGAVELLPREDEGTYYGVPRFSPDGARLAYMYSKPSGAPPALRVRDLRTGVSDWITKRGFRAGDPDWSPDGSEIVFRKLDPAKPWRDLHVMPAEGGPARNLTFWMEHDEYPAWSPDGQEIAFVRVSLAGRRLSVYDMATGEVRELTNATFEASRPAWSPDGEHLVFSGGDVEGLGRGRERRNVHAIRRDGTELRRLTQYKEGSARYPVWVDADLLPVSPGGASRVTWGRLKDVGRAR